MARILYAWELEGSLGHLTRIYPILLALERRGHQVIAAIRDLTHVKDVWPELQAELHRAPHKAYPTLHEVFPTKYYIDILYNIGWGEADDLRVLMYGWQELYEQVKPDFVIHDNSPTAILISQLLDIPHATLGTGYCCPIDKPSICLMRTSDKDDPDLEAKTTSHVLENLNGVLPPGKQLARPMQIYSRVNETFLTTFPELDHFGARQDAVYWGIPNATSGIRPEWPFGTGPKLFAYLHADAHLPGILNAIENLRFPTLIYIGGKAVQSYDLPQSATVRVVTEPVDLAWAAEQCSVGILNGSHGATTAFLLAGKPILQLPIKIEHYIGSKRCFELGAALIVDRSEPKNISPALGRLFREPDFAIRADQFRDQYRAWSPDAQCQKIVDRMEELLKKPESFVRKKPKYIISNADTMQNKPKSVP